MIDGQRRAEDMGYTSPGDAFVGQIETMVEQASKPPRPVDTWLAQWRELSRAVAALRDAGHAQAIEIGYNFTLQVGTVAHLFYDHDFRAWSQVSQYITIGDEPTTGERLRASASKPAPREYQRITELIRQNLT